ncbi:hypothetical protein [Actinopolymorpha singaporensis]|uniref:Uncharacterized protein n=1 Tax=Actinopolymorpha singaporensis TaxID=117157 RepID=A0A1H1TPK7_9ACTN|nr:hypothetical protein [Actinopolymorpha singaporensis]SDS61866.1 hypothetical protein SAMN04489717_3276 [Actinopolymorpha singaporensis]
MNDSDSGRRSGIEDANAQDWLGSNQDPDVLLSVPDLGVDKITLTVEDLQADVDLHARVLQVVDLHVGAHASLGKVDLEIDNVHAQAMLKVKLDKVAEVVDRVLRTIDNNPEIVTSLTAPVGRGVEELGRGAGEGVRALGRGSSSGTEDAASGEPAAEKAPSVETDYDVDYDEPDRDEPDRDESDRDESDRDEPDRDESDRDESDRDGGDRHGGDGDEGERRTEHRRRSAHQAGRTEPDRRGERARDRRDRDEIRSRRRRRESEGR